MKFVALLSFVCIATATPLASFDVGSQHPFGTTEELVTSYPGFDLDLSEQRLVQMDGQEPVWMTELEKVIIQKYLLWLSYLICYMLDPSQSPRVQVLRHVG